MHIITHGLVPSVGLTLWSQVGPLTIKLFPSFPVFYTYTHWSTALALVVGSLAPDIGNCGYFIAAKIANKKLPWSNTQWGPREDLLFATIDRRSYWSWTYKVSHSIPVLILVLALMYWYQGGLTSLDIAYVYGHLLHILMDHWSHQVSYSWWPLWTSVRDDPTWNWWHRQKKKPDAS